MNATTLTTVATVTELTGCPVVTCDDNPFLNSTNIKYLLITASVWGALLILVVCSCLCCFNRGSKTTDDAEAGQGQEAGEEAAEKKKSKESVGSTGEDYYNQLMQNSPKVKSISQYMNKNGKKVKKEKEEAKKAPSAESTGSNYFKQLMSKGGGKVKSISQYGKAKK
ncbi:hypothetical protein HDE_06805 [Halotydeus destructor]|nr:hypothetical protein HDE_06805 [Halotydeus destructor]